MNRPEGPHDRCQARAYRRQAVVVQPQLGKTRRPVVVLAGFGRRRHLAGLRPVRPAVGGGGSRLEAAERIDVERQRGDVVSEVQPAQAETVEGERVDETQSIVAQVELAKSP